MSEETKFECPNCHSDNIQSFEVAYRKIGIILMFLLSAILGSVSNTLGSIGALLGWVLSGAFVYKTAYLWNRDVYPQLLDQWHHSYICFRCGQHFTI